MRLLSANGRAFPVVFGVEEGSHFRVVAIALRFSDRCRRACKRFEKLGVGSSFMLRFARGHCMLRQARTSFSAPGRGFLYRHCLDVLPEKMRIALLPMVKMAEKTAPPIPPNKRMLTPRPLFLRTLECRARAMKIAHLGYVSKVQMGLYVPLFVRTPAQKTTIAFLTRGCRGLTITCASRKSRDCAARAKAIRTASVMASYRMLPDAFFKGISARFAEYRARGPVLIRTLAMK